MTYFIPPPLGFGFLHRASRRAEGGYRPDCVFSSIDVPLNSIEKIEKVQGVSNCIRLTCTDFRVLTFTFDATKKWIKGFVLLLTRYTKRPNPRQLFAYAHYSEGLLSAYKHVGRRVQEQNEDLTSTSTTLSSVQKKSMPIEGLVREDEDGERGDDGEGNELYPVKPLTSMAGESFDYDGWRLYDAVLEYRRQGLLPRSDSDSAHGADADGIDKGEEESTASSKIPRSRADSEYFMPAKIVKEEEPGTEAPARLQSSQSLNSRRLAVPLETFLCRNGKNKWRLFLNDYLISETYPRVFLIPARFSNHEVRQAAAYRSNGRIPVITWGHHSGKCVLVRSSQPMSGLVGHRSLADERLIDLYRVSGGISKDNRTGPSVNDSETASYIARARQLSEENTGSVQKNGIFDTAVATTGRYRGESFHQRAMTVDSSEGGTGQKRRLRRSTESRWVEVGEIGRGIGQASLLQPPRILHFPLSPGVHLGSGRDRAPSSVEAPSSARIKGSTVASSVASNASAASALWGSMTIGARKHKDSRSSDGKTEPKKQGLDTVLVPRGKSRTKEAMKREQKQKAGEFASDDSHFYIIDARSPLAAKANEFGGKGVEDSSHYCIGKATIEYMYIENIHRVRDSLHALVALLVKQPGTIDASDDSKWFARLEATHWLKHIRMILEGSVRIVEIMEIKQSSVLCHCSDGWDRTSQLCATAELLMDPYYRTLRGLAVLIEKDWCSFGHKFHERTNCGGDTGKPDDVSPIALQFVEVIWQILRQFPCAFEYNERYLLAILDAMYSTRFGTFLFNCEKERVDNNVFTGKLLSTFFAHLVAAEHKTNHKLQCCAETVSLWTHLLSPINIALYVNPRYVPCFHTLWPSFDAKNIVLWEGYFLRYDSETQKRLQYL